MDENAPDINLAMYTSELRMWLGEYHIYLKCTGKAF